MENEKRSKEQTKKLDSTKLLIDSQQRTIIVDLFMIVMTQITMTMMVVGRWGSFIKTKHIILGRRKTSPFYLQKFFKKGIDLYNMLCYYIITERK